MTNKKKRTDDFDDEFDKFIANIIRFFTSTFDAFFTPQPHARPRRPLTINKVFVDETNVEKRPVAHLKEDDKLKLFIDLRGAKEDSIRVEQRGNKLIVEALTVDGFYRDEFVLPFLSRKNKIEKKYYNGILEITIE